MGPVTSFVGLNHCLYLEKVSLAGNWDGISTTFGAISHSYIGGSSPNGVDFTFPPGLTEMGFQSFYNAKFASTTLTLPDSLVTIGWQAFYNQVKPFKRIIFGSKLTTISEKGYGAFNRALTSDGCYTFSGATPPWYDVADKRLPGTTGTAGFPCKGS